MVNGYQNRYAPPAQRPQLGAISNMGLKQWAMLGGGAVVAAAGITAGISALPSRKRKVQLVGLAVAAVVTLVGGTAFIDNFNTLTA